MNQLNKKKICLISSPGGHLYKTLRLKPWWQKHDRFWVTSSLAKKLGVLKNEKVYYGHFPVSRNGLNFFKNLWLAVKVLRIEKPDIIISLGAGVAPPFFLVGKLMGIKLIFIETFIFSPQTTLSGRLVYPITDHFIIQNPKLKKNYPKAKFNGTLL